MTKSKENTAFDTVIFDKQIPVNNINVNAFKKAIVNKNVKCSINGVRVNNPDTKNVTVDISFKILCDFEMINPGTSATGKPLSTSPMFGYGNNNKLSNVKGKNVTLTFNALKTKEKGVILIINKHELYNIVVTILKFKSMIGNEEKGSIRTHYTKLDDLLKKGVVNLTSVPVASRMGTSFEINAVVEETQIIE